MRKSVPMPTSSAVEIEIFHSNIEGEVINRLYAAHDEGIAGAIINPSGYSRGYPALVAAIGNVGFPTIEVHISNPARRGAVSEVASTCLGSCHRLRHRGLRARLARSPGPGQGPRLESAGDLSLTCGATGTPLRHPRARPPAASPRQMDGAPRRRTTGTDILAVLGLRGRHHRAADNDRLLTGRPAFSGKSPLDWSGAAPTAPLPPIKGPPPVPHRCGHPSQSR